MASLKTDQQRGHPWAWFIVGECQKCRIEALETAKDLLIRDRDRLRAIVDQIPERITPADIYGTCYCADCSFPVHIGHAIDCLYYIAQEALKGQDHKHYGLTESE